VHRHAFACRGQVLLQLCVLSRLDSDSFGCSAVAAFCSATIAALTSFSLRVISQPRTKASSCPLL
jgi:hypothetical protein